MRSALVSRAPLGSVQLYHGMPNHLSGRSSAGPGPGAPDWSDTPEGRAAAHRQKSIAYNAAASPAGHPLNTPMPPAVASADSGGLMGGPARKLDPETGKMMAVPGVSIFLGGTVGEGAHLSLEPYKTGVPMEDETLIPELVAIAKEHFGAVDK